jgi:hypothetical protein
VCADNTPPAAYLVCMSHSGCCIRSSRM